MIIYIDTPIEISLATGPDYCELQHDAFKGMLKNKCVRHKFIEGRKYLIHEQKCCLSEENAMQVLSELCIIESECDFSFGELGELEIRVRGEHND